MKLGRAPLVVIVQQAKRGLSIGNSGQTLRSKLMSNLKMGKLR